MRKQIAAGNWKMNLTYGEAQELSNEIGNMDIPDDVEVILGVPFPYLPLTLETTQSNDRVFIAAQDCSAHESGAYTAEVAANMLRGIGVTHVIVGHSERREYHNETDLVILSKIRRALSNELTPIFCCGEPLNIRESGQHIDYVRNQLQNSVLQLTNNEFSKIIVAYEPIWAIGTGKTASPEQAQEIQNEIRSVLESSFGDLASKTSILYGGSVKPQNAKEIFGQADVDGGLVGGASLSADSFREIILSF